VLLIGSVGALAVNIGLNLVLIPRYGPAGSAAATSISYAVELALLYPPARARVGPPRLARPLAPAVAGALVLAAVLLLPLPFAPALVAGSVLYLVTWYLLASWLDAEQVGVMRGLLPGRGAGREPIADPALETPA
jgi:peptidoglycan biosynthesis protein MviN/MurJ (putative lipid II flippase)